MKIPFSQQRLRSNPVEIIRARLERRDEAVSGAQLLSAVEETIGSALPSDLRALFALFSAPAKASRGRPTNNRAKEDFTMEELDHEYSRLLHEFRESGATEADGPPSELAYRQLAAEMKDVFGNIDWRALRNKHSSWRTGRIYGPREDLVDSDGFDAEIERQFPAHNK